MPCGVLTAVFGCGVLAKAKQGGANCRPIFVKSISQQECLNMGLSPLRLHSEIFPRLRDLANRSHDGTKFGDVMSGDISQDEFWAPMEAQLQLDDLVNAVIFDCRKLPLAFVGDTGNAAFDEGQQTTLIVRLPFPHCYFELDGLAIFAQEVDNDDPKAPYVDFILYETTSEAAFIKSVLNSVFLSNGRKDHLHNSEEDLEEGEKIPLLRYREHPNQILDTAAMSVLGILSLLNEQLIATEILPDPAPKLTKRRIKLGRLPLTAEMRVLTVNVAAVRRLAKASPLRTHESPSLHWRRGHWRHLHRYSEFESKTWVRKCLVGDPDRGFVPKNYALKYEQPMFLETQKA
jgi:hypothetical protein